MPQLTMLWPRVSGASRLPLVNSGVAAMAMPACLLCFKRFALAKNYAVVVCRPVGTTYFRTAFLIFATQFRLSVSSRHS